MSQSEAHHHPHHAHRAGRAHLHRGPGYRVPMPAALRRATYVIFAALWVTGSFWLILHLGFARQTDFGPEPNPWEPTVLRIHGWIAVATVFLLGWLSAQHIGDRWSSPRNRVSGLLLVGAAALLVLTGYALYYTTDRLHDSAGVIHEILGGAAILVALTHWLRRGIRR